MLWLDVLDSYCVVLDMLRANKDQELIMSAESLKEFNRSFVNMNEKERASVRWDSDDIDCIKFHFKGYIFNIVVDG